MERSDAARRPARQHGLAPVTYLPGARSGQVQPPVDQPLADEPAADSPAVDTGVRPSDRLPHPLGRDLPTLASVFGQLESEIEAQLVERRAADERAASTEGRAEARAAAKAERISMNALTRRGMSYREVERSLRARELDDDTIVAELERLVGVGLIDDMALAQNLVGILQERKGLGRSAIAAELTRRLLAPAAIEYALELIDTGDELGRARELAVKRASQLRSYDRETAVRRLSGFLMRRGYSGSAVRAAVEFALPASSSAGSTVRFR
jgi:regulatory protein